MIILRDIKFIMSSNHVSSNLINEFFRTVEVRLEIKNIKNIFELYKVIYFRVTCIVLVTCTIS